jgi:hypothetical protein
MQLEIWNLENSQEQGEARQLEAQPKPWETSTFKWQMEEKSPGRKAEKEPSRGVRRTTVVSELQAVRDEKRIPRTVTKALKIS